FSGYHIPVHICHVQNKSNMVLLFKECYYRIKKFVFGHAHTLHQRIVGINLIVAKFHQFIATKAFFKHIIQLLAYLFVFKITCWYFVISKETHIMRTTMVSG